MRAAIEGKRKDQTSPGGALVSPNIVPRDVIGQNLRVLSARAALDKSNQVIQTSLTNRIAQLDIGRRKNPVDVFGVARRFAEPVAHQHAATQNQMVAPRRTRHQTEQMRAHFRARSLPLQTLVRRNRRLLAQHESAPIMFECRIENAWARGIRSRFSRSQRARSIGLHTFRRHRILSRLSRQTRQNGG